MAGADEHLSHGQLEQAIGRLKAAVVQEPQLFRLHDRLRQLLLAKGDLDGSTRVTLMLVKLAVAAREVGPARAAVAYALALAPTNPTVNMLAGRLNVTKAADLPKPAPPPEPEVTFEDDLVDDAAEEWGEDQDGLVDDEGPNTGTFSLADDVEYEDDGLVDDGGDTDWTDADEVTGAIDLQTLYITPVEESDDDTAEKTLVLPEGEGIIDDLEDDDDSFDLAAELEGNEAPQSVINPDQAR